MKRIKVHEPIQLYNLINDQPLAENATEIVDGVVKLKVDDKGQPVIEVCKPWAFYEILNRFVFPSGAFGKGKKAGKSMRKLNQIFKNAVPGSVVAVEDSEYELLKKVADENEWPTVITGQIGDFFDAIDNATD